MTQLRDAKGRPVELLLIDDDVVDTMAIKRAANQLDVRLPMTTVQNGLEALHCLRGTNGRQPLAWPFLILLDINMPVMNGLAFLEELRNDPMLNHSVVFVMTTSDAQVDRSMAYGLNAAGYIIKTGAPGMYRKTIDMLARFCAVVELPTR